MQNRQMTILELATQNKLRELTSDEIKAIGLDPEKLSEGLLKEVAKQLQVNIVIEKLRAAQERVDQILVEAIKANDFEKVRLALSMRADPNYIYIEHGHKRSAFALIFGKSKAVEMATLLIEGGANIAEIELKQKVSMLYWAIHSHSMELFELFLKHGASVKAEDSYNTLSMAIERCNYPVVERLLNMEEVGNYQLRVTDMRYGYRSTGEFMVYEFNVLFNAESEARAEAVLKRINFGMQASSDSEICKVTRNWIRQIFVSELDKHEKLLTFIKDKRQLCFEKAKLEMIAKGLTVIQPKNPDEIKTAMKKLMTLIAALEKRIGKMSTDNAHLFFSAVKDQPIGGRDNVNDSQLERVGPSKDTL